jgi:hypothetical protein
MLPKNDTPLPIYRGHNYVRLFFHERYVLMLSSEENRWALLVDWSLSHVIKYVGKFN